MDNTSLEEKLSKLKAQIKTNSKDAHFADKLISDLLSVKGQLDVEATVLNVAEKDVTSHFKGEYFDVYMLKDGAMYSTTGGFFVYAKGNHRAFCNALRGIAESEQASKDLSDEEKNLIDLDNSATGYILSLPSFAFSDYDFKFNIASEIVKYLRETSEEMMNKAPQDETPVEDREFKDAVLAVGNLTEVKS